jgi:hypothetical protein
MFYLNNKDSGSSGIKNGIMVVCIMIAAIGITGFLNMNINIYDLLISSQINILCLFFFLSYIGVTTISSWDLMIDIGTFSSKVLGLITNPTELFNKGFDLIIPTIFMLIPFIILVTNFLKMSGINFIGAVVGAILTALISIVVVYFCLYLYSRNLARCRLCATWRSILKRIYYQAMGITYQTRCRPRRFFVLPFCSFVFWVFPCYSLLPSIACKKRYYKRKCL